MTPEELKNKISSTINRIYDNLTDKDYKDLIFYLARHRLKYFIENYENSIDSHFKKQLFNKDSEKKTKPFSDYLDNKTIIGKNIFSELEKSSQHIKEWEKEKKNYEESTKESFFIELDEIKPIEKIFLYSLLKLDKFEQLKSYSIKNGCFLDFYDLMIESTSKILINKECLTEIKTKEIGKDFLYHFQHFFAKEISINPYYDYKISHDNEIEEKYIGKLTEAIKGKINELKNKIKIK